MRLRLWNQPVKVRSIFGFEPYLCSACPRAARKLDDCLEQRRRGVTITRCNLCHPTRHAIRADQGFGLEFLDSVPVGVSDRESDAFITRPDINHLATTTDLDSGIESFSGEQADHPCSFNYEIRLLHRNAHRPPRRLEINSI